jgi:biopolymer transport protein ExbB
VELFGKIALAFEHGGIWMYPILLVQIASLAIVGERVYALFINRKMNQRLFVAGFEQIIRRGRIEEAIETAKNNSAQYPVARAIAAGGQAALNFGGKEEIQGKMDEVLLEENAKVEKRTAFLAMMGNVATLIGLLGTITGMISSFAAVAGANPAEKATLLAAGISEAMNCTAYGLITAIPALLMYAILLNRANTLNEDLNHSALKVFNWLSYSFDHVATTTGKSSTRDNNRGPEATA